MPTGLRTGRSTGASPALGEGQEQRKGMCVPPSGGYSAAALFGETAARSAASSGRQEPQLVPARSAAPISATLAARPEATASTMAFEPTSKQAQTIGPRSGIAASGRPASSAVASASPKA